MMNCLSVVPCLVVLMVMVFSKTSAQNCSDPNTEFAPHPTDCNLYYACVGGEGILENCPLGLWWNPTTELCDWPEDSGCNAGGTSTVTSSSSTASSNGSSTSTTSRPPTETSSGSSTVSTTNLPTETTSPTESICSDPDSEFAPHPTDCNLYYACVGGEAILENCPPGLWWNSTADVCDWPEDSGCNAGGTSIATSSSSTATSNISSTATSTGLPTETTSESSTASPCSDPDSEFAPHPTDCNLYYACVGGEAILENCPPGLWWNSTADVCDWPEDSGCNAGGTSTVISSSSTATSNISSTVTSTGLPTETSTGSSTVTSTGTSSGSSTVSTSTQTTSQIPTEPPYINVQ